jgi:hypothetical protein
VNCSAPEPELSSEVDTANADTVPCSCLLHPYYKTRLYFRFIFISHSVPQASIGKGVRTHAPGGRLDWAAHLCPLSHP